MNRLKPPRDAIIFLRDLLNIKHFVETGTGLGRTTHMVAPLFEQVTTMELNDMRWDVAIRAFAPQKHVTCLHGHSVDLLPGVLEDLVGPAMFFLDAHCVSRALKAPMTCPLLEEIALVRTHSPYHVLLIDDVHFFVASAPRRSVGQWPGLVDIINALQIAGKPYVVIYGDNFIAVPDGIRSSVDEFLGKVEGHG